MDHTAGLVARHALALLTAVPENLPPLGAGERNHPPWKRKRRDGEEQILKARTTGGDSAEPEAVPLAIFGHGSQ